MFSSSLRPEDSLPAEKISTDQHPLSGSTAGDEFIEAAEPTMFPADAFGQKSFDGINPAELMSLDQLLASLDVPRRERPRKDMRPMWLRDIIDCVGDLFEPLAHAGRVGFDCVPKDGRWHVSFYLGAAEHVGGPLDGHVEAINFQFNIASLLKCFERVDLCEWRVFPTPEAIGIDAVSREDIPRGLSSVVVEGIAMTESGLGEPLTIEVHSVPPASSEVALKLYADGEIDIAD